MVIATSPWAFCEGGGIWFCASAELASRAENNIAARIDASPYGFGGSVLQQRFQVNEQVAGHQAAGAMSSSLSRGRRARRARGARGSSAAASGAGAIAGGSTSSAI